MAPSVTQQGRYPKRKRAKVNYDVEQSFVDVSDLEDDGYFSEELGEAAPGSPHTPANASSAHQADSITVVEIDSEYEDATFGSRKILKKVCITLRVGACNSLTRVHSARSFAFIHPRPSALPSSCRSDSCKPFGALATRSILTIAQGSAPRASPESLRGSPC